MSKVKEKNCRLCLKTLDDDYSVLDETTRGNFEILQLKADLSISDEPVVCKTCMEDIQEAYVFKFTCISANVQVVSLAIDRNSAELDIRDVYLNENENKSLAFSVDYSICRFCLQCQEKSNCNLLNDLRKDSIDEMLLKCIPELDLNIIKEPVVCTACMKSLESYYSLAIKCQNTEENIMKYREIQGAECNEQISLSNVLKFVIKSTSEFIDNCSTSDVLKKEDIVFQNEKKTYSDINNIVCKIEEEEAVIKDENKTGDCETKESWYDEIREKEVLKYDMQTHKDSSDAVILRCAWCTFETEQKSYFKRHMLLIHQDNSEVMYKCNLCSYKAKWKSKLTRHMIIHKDSSDATMFRCALCAFKTVNKGDLKRHKLVHKDNSEVIMYKCNLCSYETKWKYYLKYHMVSHTDSSDIVMYKCEECTFKTKHRSSIRKHMMVHKDSTEVTMYKCNLCSYEAKRKDSLNVHIKSIHKDSSNAVMFKCKMCTFETVYKYSLNVHALTHKDNFEVTMFKCNLCNYETKLKRYLRYHMITHKDSSDAVVYRCESCTYESKYKHNLKKHMVVHRDKTEMTTYKCNLCSYEAKWKTNLKVHIKTIHKDSSDVVT